MRLPFEQWIAEFDLPQESEVAFRESILCYKSGAYRASFLFAYIGFNLLLRNRLLMASCPPGVLQPQWDAIHKDLRNEDKWDAQVFDTTQMKPPKVIFDVSDDIRDQVKYWKNRRNDCAHFKQNPISYSHIESFWLFIQANSNRLVIVGSSQDIISLIETHFDPNFTPPGADLMPVVEKIPSSVDLANIESFFDEIVNLFGGVGSRFIGKNKRCLASIFSSIFRLRDQNIIRETALYISKQEELLMSCLGADPSLVPYFANDPIIIRRLWRELIFDGGNQGSKIFAGLLRNGLIPQDQLDEANEWASEHWKGEIPDSMDVDALNRFGFFAAFYKLAFERHRIDEFAWGNRNSKMVRWYIESVPMNKQIAKAISSTFSTPPHPFELRDELKELFSTNASKKSELDALVQAEGLVPPACIV